MAESRSEILNRLRQKIARGEAIVGGGAGVGISAKCEEAGGIDLIVIYNSGRFRMAGHGSLAGLMPFGDANAIVLEMAGRGAAGREEHPRAGGRLRDGPDAPDGPFPRAGQGRGLRRRAELSDRRSH